MVERASDPAPLFALVAEFDDVTSVKEAARRVRDAGYTRFDVYSPFPIHGIDRAMGIRSTRLPWIVLASGLTGLSCALLLQWWTNGVDYPFRISGKPLFGLPAAIPITFEVTVLFSAFAAFFGMLLLNRLPQHHHSIFEHGRFARASDDGFFLAVEAADPRFDATAVRALLESSSRRAVVACATSDAGAALPAWVRSAGLAVGALALVPIGAIVAARSGDTTDPPFHLVRDMDSQPRFRAQAGNAHFADGRAMRADVAGTVAFGELASDPALASGKRGDQWCSEIPLRVDARLLERGRERFGISCAPCHGLAGFGDGLVALRAAELQESAWVPPASLHDAVVRGRSVGELFATVRNGVRTMPAYARQVSVEDTWAIVAYVKALQRSQRAAPADVPPAERARLGL